MGVSVPRAHELTVAWVRKYSTSSMALITLAVTNGSSWCQPCSTPAVSTTATAVTPERPLSQAIARSIAAGDGNTASTVRWAEMLRRGGVAAGIGGGDLPEVRAEREVTDERQLLVGRRGHRARRRRWS